MIGHSTDKALSEDLWQTTLNTMGTIEMDADFTNSLRGWIVMAKARLLPMVEIGDEIMESDRTSGLAIASKIGGYELFLRRKGPL
jgi:hypothetical protein